MPDSAARRPGTSVDWSLPYPSRRQPVIARKAASPDHVHPSEAVLSFGISQPSRLTIFLLGADWVPRNHPIAVLECACLRTQHCELCLLLQRNLRVRQRCP